MRLYWWPGCQVGIAYNLLVCATYKHVDMM